MTSENQNISQKFAQGKTVYSVEFFPPKTEEGARQILRSANEISKKLNLDYVSITYGAGGSTRERTLDYGELLKDIFSFDVMPHLTCVGHSKAEIHSILERFASKNFCNIMALRGDPPKGESEFKPHPDGFKYANELVEYVKNNFPSFSIGCAAYPEKHPEAKSLKEDVQNLKRKVDAGADFIVSQMFFDNKKFFDFCNVCRGEGIEKPIIAGILPALSLKQVANFASMCQAYLPEELINGLKDVENDEEKSAQVGLNWAKAQVEELVANKVAGVHLYVLNRSKAALEIAKNFSGK